MSGLSTTFPIKRDNECRALCTYLVLEFLFTCTWNSTRYILYITNTYFHERTRAIGKRQPKQTRPQRYYQQRNQTRTMATKEDRRRWMDLQRLLYCMDKQPGPMKGQSWQSLLLRAQLAQDLWHEVAITVANDTSVYDELAHQVDQACRKAHELADIHRHESSESSKKDLIQSIFFPLEEVGKERIPEEEDTEFDDEDDRSLEDEGHEAEINEKRGVLNVDETTKTKAAASRVSMEELQQTQRDQMEEAISLMAKQMKEATQGIHHTLRQQTAKTLTELEDVAEQNVQDVTQVAQNVQQHNRARFKSNLGTWTMMLSLLGVWAFTLVTIFTIPKRPNACLLFCGKNSRLSRTLASVTKMTKYGVSSVKSLIWEEDLVEAEEEEAQRNAEEAWKDLYEETAYQRQQKEKLDQLLHKIQVQQPKKNEEDDAGWRNGLIEEEAERNPLGRKAKDTASVENSFGAEGQDDEVYHDDDDGYYDDDGEEEEEVELDNPWGLKPVDTDDASLLEDITLEDIANRWDSQGEGANMEDYEVYEGHGKEKLDKLLDYLQSGELTEERPPRSDRTSGERLEYTHSQHEGEDDDDLDAYFQAGRARLVRRFKQSDNENWDENEEDIDDYVKAGRNRLDALLGPDDSVGSDEL